MKRRERPCWSRLQDLGCNGPMAGYREPLIYINVLPRNRISVLKALCC